MQEVFEKIIEKLEEIREQKTCTKEKCDEKEIRRICVVDDAIKIVKQEAEQYNNGQTNADRIRSMTDAELALAIMCPAEYDSNFNKNEKCNGEMNKNCYECSLKWLRAESEE